MNWSDQIILLFVLHFQVMVGYNYMSCIVMSPLCQLLKNSM